MADHLRTELVADALANAVAARDPDPSVIFHSDRGCQYTSAAFADLAADCQVTLSVGPHRPMLGQRHRRDRSSPRSRASSSTPHLADPGPAQRAVVDYIGWYNGTRLHSTLGYRTPAEFESHYRKGDPASSLTSHQPCPSKSGASPFRDSMQV